MKDITKVIKSLENRGILLKETSRKAIGQKWGFLNFLQPLMTADLSFIKNILTPLTKSVLIPLGLTAVSTKDAAIQKKIFGSGMTAWIISNEEMEDIMKIVKPPEESGLVMKGISEITKSEAK